MMTKNAYAFVVIEKSIMVFKCAKDKGLIPIFEGFVPLKEGFLRSFKERCNLEFLENLDLLFLYDYPFSSEVFSLCKDLKNSIKAIVIDSMKTYHQSQQEKYKRERGETIEIRPTTPPSYGGGSIRISGDKKPDSNEENF